MAAPSYGAVATEAAGDAAPVEAPRRRRPSLWGAVLALGVVAVASVGVFSHSSLSRTARVRAPMVVKAALQQHGQKGWKLVGKADPEQMITLRMMLRLSNEQLLEELAMAVSDPAHAEYGKHRTMQEVADLVRPAPEDAQQVERWLADHGVPAGRVNRTVAGDVVSVTVPVRVAEEMLRAEYLSYQLPGRESQAPVLRTKSYSLPEGLVDVVDWVGPTVTFPMVRSVAAVGGNPAQQQHHQQQRAHKGKHAPKRRAAEAHAMSKEARQIADTANAELDKKLAAHRRMAEAAATKAGFKTDAQKIQSGAGGLVDPKRLKQWYDVDPNFEGTAKHNKQGVVGFLGEHKASRSDMLQFLKRYAKTELRLGVAPDSIVDEGDGYAGIESTLDLEYIMAMAVGVPTEFYYYNGREHNADGDAENEPFLHWLQEVGHMSDQALPRVFSISYADWEVSVPKAYADRTNKALMQMALRGVSVIAASGDGGVEGAGHLPHQAWDHRCDRGDQLLSTFPASSPWVTSVGAVTGFPAQAAKLSAGGFSNYFDMPSYQARDVKMYLSHCSTHFMDGLKGARLKQAMRDFKKKCNKGNHRSSPPLPNMKTFNENGRGIPDVAMQGRNYMVYFGQSWTHVDGTSASTPTFAAMISGINDARLNAGQPALGFLNPALYSMDVRHAFDDIEEGSNPGCGIEGFYASTGWDPVTGLGTPNMNRLKEALMSVAGGSSHRRATEKASLGPGSRHARGKHHRRRV